MSPQENLPDLATRFGTDKWGAHRYAEHYERHFHPYQSRPMNLLEIGAGGYDDPKAGGASLRMWKAFFPLANIYAIDVIDKSALEEPRIRIFQGDQGDPAFLRQVGESVGKFDIIVDDGSHINSHVILSFHTLFPYLAEGGVYAIEDLQTSYWPGYGGSEDPHARGTTIALCKQLVDGLNWEEFYERNPAPFDHQIKSIHFYHNLVLIDKGPNQEGSNIVNRKVASRPRE